MLNIYRDQLKVKKSIIERKKNREKSIKQLQEALSVEGGHDQMKLSEAIKNAKF